jgi:hypothetical protein
VFPAEFEHPLLPAPKMRASAEAEKGAPAADSQRPLHVAEDRPAIAPQPQAEQPKADAGGTTATAAKTASAAADPPLQPSPVEAEAPAAGSQQQGEQPKVEAGAEVASAAAAPAADSQQPPLDSADAPSKTEQDAEKPKLETVTDKPASSAPSSPAAVAERLTVNPHQYAQQLKAKAVAEAAAANRAVKALSAEVGMTQNEAARAATALRAAEAAQATARVRADAAAAFSAAATAAADSQQEPAVAAERSASAGDALAKANADRLTRAYGKALFTQDAALQAKINADSALAEATAKLDQARTASAAKAADRADAERRLDEARTTAAAAATAQREAERRVTPISVLISKKDRRIYVRQALSPLFDAPIEIRDPDTPLGSHLYIATAAKEDGSSLKWSVVSMPEARTERRKDLASADAKADISWDWRPAGASPSEALERVDIPKDVRDRIAERLWTGASLIISDQPVSGETGNDGTDLTIKLR